MVPVHEDGAQQRDTENKLRNTETQIETRVESLTWVKPGTCLTWVFMYTRAQN